MTPQEKKAAVAAYKDREAAHGVYAVICNATGEAWVGCSRHVDTQQTVCGSAFDTAETVTHRCSTLGMSMAKQNSDTKNSIA